MLSKIAIKCPFVYMIKAIKIELIDDIDRITDITRKLSYKFTKDDSYIENEIKLYASKTLLLKLEVEHMCGKIVTES